MSSDRARVSYDASRQYRSVVAQQGRVTLEADINEAQQIAAENLRAETMDIVGRCGTPDDGYAVVGGQQPPDVYIEPGTMYVGGLRVQVGSTEYAQQTEWLDRDGDPLWLDPHKVDLETPEFIYLLLREQEVSAIEDVPLREAALGGPDTAQRTRLIQRFVRMPVNAKDCTAALDTAKQKWSELGVDFDEKTMRLISPARLQVKFVQQPVPESPCDPQVRGGYLGADNQLIRVQITRYDAATNTGHFVWGYNNASFLYRVAATDTQSVDLKSAPIDAYHTPRANHPVEVLRSAVDLGADNFVAALCGIVAVPTEGYVSDSRRLALPAATLPGSYVGTKSPLFLRLWEAEVAFTPGQVADLAGTGLQVVIDLGQKFGSLTVGQFWMFAVRPSAPVDLYPQRYLDTPQPPEGPRMWACPLAVFGWVQRKLSVLADCRAKFDDLVELTKRHTQCCSIVVEPKDVDGGAGLQTLLDGLGGKLATVSLQPGRYELPRPLLLRNVHAGLTLEGCRDGVVLAARVDVKDRFDAGLVMSDSAPSDVTLRRLRFELPLARMGGEPIATSIGIRAVGCANLRIEQCVFQFASVPDLGVKAVAIWTSAACPGLHLERNRFLRDRPGGDEKPLPRYFVGIAAMPDRLPDQVGASGQSNDLPAVVDNASIVGNEFSGLTLAVFVRGELGRLRCESNLAHDCDGGFYFANADLQRLRAALLDAFQNQSRSPADEALFSTLLHAAQPSVFAAMQELAAHAQLPAGAAAAVVTAPDGVTAAKARLANAQSPANLAAADAKPIATVPAAPATAANNAAPSPATPPDAAAGAVQPAAVTLTAEQINQLTAALTVMLPAAAVAAPLVADLRFAGNDVVTVPSSDKTRANAGPAPMVALSIAVAPGASVMLSANIIRGSNLKPLATVVQPSTAVITGNLISNLADSGDRTSFYISVVDQVVNDKVVAKALMSVSGNTFHGQPSINPVLPAQAGSDAAGWKFLNSWTT